MRLSIGSVQWGLNYGISNNDGKTDKQEVREILNYAALHDIWHIDTAPSYGDAEKTIGSLNNEKFQITTKTPKISLDEDHQTIINKFILTIDNSFLNLKRKKIFSIIFHDTSLLNSEFGKILWDKLYEYKILGKIDMIGVSIYDEDEIKNILQNFTPDVVQLPLNIFDQRFVNNGVINKLVKNNIKVHVRSVFLQGLLLLEEDNLPKKLEKYKSYLNDFSNLVSQIGISKLEACILFVREFKEVSNVIIGISNLKQLKAVNNIFNSDKSIDMNIFKKLNKIEKDLVDPRLW